MDGTTEPGGQVPPAPAGQVPPAAASGQVPPAAPPKEELDAAALRRELDEARREAAKHRTDLKKLQDAQLSEQERKDRAAADLVAAHERTQAENRTLRVENALRAQAETLTLAPKWVSAALRLLDNDLLQWDATTGALVPESLEKAVKALLKQYPDMALPAPADPAAPTSGARPTNPARPPGGPPATPGAIDWNHLGTWDEALAPPGGRT